MPIRWDMQYKMIRLASINDIERIVEIYEHIHDVEENNEAIIGWDRNVYSTKDTAIEGIACTEMFVEDCLWEYEANEEEVMVLHTLVVDPKIKGHGYGKDFVKFYEEYTLAKNCNYLRIDTQEKMSMPEAIRF